MRDELDIQTLQRAKANAVAYYHAEDTDHEFWEQCVEDIDDEIKDIGKEPDLKPARSRIRWWVWFINAAVVITILYFACTSCNATKAGINFGGAVFKDAGWVLTEMSNNIEIKE